MLQHSHDQISLAQLAHDHGRERAIDRQVSPEQDPADVKTGAQEVAAQPRRNVKHRDRVADERQGGLDPFVSHLTGIDGEVTSLAPRRRSQRGQMDREPLLQLACTARRDQGRARRPRADIDEEARPVGLGAGAGERRGRGPRSARRADRGDDDDATVHGSAGLA